MVKVGQCHINDLPECVKSQVRLFADDCLLYREIKSQQDHQILQEDLKSLELWADKWGMKFNAGFTRDFTDVATPFQVVGDVLSPKYGFVFTCSRMC
jgi:hypothetical protein